MYYDVDTETSTTAKNAFQYTITLILLNKVNDADLGSSALDTYVPNMKIICCAFVYRITRNHHEFFPTTDIKL